MANILETAQARHTYNKYLRGLEPVEGLKETLNGPGPFTVFLPTDGAFERLSDEQQARLYADRGTMAKVLKYHIVPGYYTVEDLLDHLFLKTLEGPRLRVSSDISQTPLWEEETTFDDTALDYISSEIVATAVRKSITINGAHVVKADLIADNGILHVIDKLLVPPFIRL